MSIGPVQDEFQRQLDIAQKVMAEDHNLLKKLSEKLEGRPMAAPATIRNFAGTLRDHLKRATDRMEKMASDFGQTVDNLHHRLDETDSLKKEVDAAAAEIQQVIGTPNGGPPLEK